MRHFFILLFLGCISFGFAQDYNTQLEEIINSEAKSASQRNAFTTNSNTQNYDVTYHKLQFVIDPAVAHISGVVTTQFRAKETINQITFDLADNMIVSKVLEDGNSLSFTQNTNDELVITLSSTLVQNEIGSVEITYSGTPTSTGFDSFESSTHNGEPILWTLSEPYGAKDWWPCKQDLNDKIDEIDVYITTPLLSPNGNQYFAVSNGLEQSQTVNGAFKTTHFKHQYPIPAYLIAIAATNYSIYSHQVPNNGNPFEIVNYVYPEQLETSKIQTAITVDIMELYSLLFEEYPYASEKYGHAQFGWGGGMEHTTVSFMGSFSRRLIAHELAHQWFGNKVTCGSWKDIWLNEGFASYCEGLVIEHLDGNSSFTTWKEDRINYITSQTNGSVYLSDQDTTSVSRIFNGRLSYSKGAMVLHMLRKKIGDTQFYQGLQNYLEDPNHAYGYAKTEHFITIMEAACGEDLTEFFNDWLYNEGYPSYSVIWNQSAPTEISLQLSQAQSHASVSFFEASVPIRVHGTLGEVLDIMLDHNTNNQIFTRTVNFTVALVEFDPENDLISRNNTVTLGLIEKNINNSIRIYPNPTSEIIYIEKPENLLITNIKIYNALGQFIKTFNYTEYLDVSDLSAGLHIITLETNKEIFHKSLLKQ